MFPHNAQKKPFADSMSRFAESKALSEIRKRGQEWPGHVVSVESSMIVTVAFDIEVPEGELPPPTVTMPVFGPEYLRQPIQVDDLGAALSFSTLIGNVSGLGVGPNPNIDTQQGNLSMLVWVPVGNIDWTAVDLNTLVLYGPAGGNGVLLQDVVDAPGIRISIKNGVFKVTAGTHVLQVSAAGTVFDGITWGTHSHSPGTYQAGGDPVTGEAGSPQNP